MSKKTLNLSNYAKNLADINEISVVLKLMELTPTPDMNKEMGVLKEELKGVEEKLEAVIKKMESDSPDMSEKLKGALEAKKNIAPPAVAKKIVEVVTKNNKIQNVSWTNTPRKFTQFCQKEHYNNPADMVIKFQGDDHYLGISLKASSGKTDIGQYNGSICSFITGLIKMDEKITLNSDIPGKCKKCSKTFGMKIQNDCDSLKNIFYLEMTEMDFGFDIKNTRQENIKSYKVFFEGDDIDRQNEIKGMRQDLLIQCRDYYFNECFGSGDVVSRIMDKEEARQLIANYLRITLDLKSSDIVPYVKHPF